jgi:hypothetical protein
MAKAKDEVKLTLDGGGLTLTRMVSDAVAQQIVSLVLGGPVAQPQLVAPAGAGFIPAGAAGEQGGNPKNFMSQKRPATDIERVTCLAWFLTNERNTPAFKTKDLTEINRDAAQPRFSNLSATARNAVSEGYLAPAGGGQKQITARGDAFVVALPDRDKVRAALELLPKSKRRKPSAKKVKKKS